MDLNIIQIAVGVFIGNICTLVVWWAYREMHRPDGRSLQPYVAFILIVGLATLMLIAQKWDMQAAGLL